MRLGALTLVTVWFWAAACGGTSVETRSDADSGSGGTVMGVGGARTGGSGGSSGSSTIGGMGAAGGRGGSSNPGGMPAVGGFAGSGANGGAAGVVGTGGTNIGGVPNAGGVASGGRAGSAGSAGNGGSAGSAGSAGNGGSAGSEAGSGGTTTAGTGGDAGADSGAGGGPTGSTELSSCSNTLRGYIRDFQPETHPDFEPQNTQIPGHIAGKDDVFETGIVDALVDPNWKPVYAGPSEGTLSTTGPQNFESWFRDVPGLNMAAELELAFEDPEGDGVFHIDRTGASTNQFFPIDNGDSCPAEPKTPCLLGNWPSYPTHNFHMTFELHAHFIYTPGSSFVFVGDDDVWVFLNGSLVLDLGGIHNQLEQVVLLDDVASQTGMIEGETYRLDFFWAERKAVNSNFRIETNLKFSDCGVLAPLN